MSVFKCSSYAAFSRIIQNGMNNSGGDGSWTILKGSILGIYENVGVSKKARKIRLDLPLDESGKLLEDFCLEECSPSFAGAVVLNASNDGWIDWKNKDGSSADIYRAKEYDE